MRVVRRILAAPLALKLLIGFGLGIATGVMLGPGAEVLAPIGTVFLNLLAMIMVPLVIASIVTAVSNSDPLAVGKTGVGIILYYMVTTAVAVAIGMFFANAFELGAGGSLEGLVAEHPEPVSPLDTLMGIVPRNVVEAMSTGDVLAIIFFALAFGFALGFVRHGANSEGKRYGQAVFDFFEGTNRVLMTLLRGILQVAPIGVFAVGATAIGSSSPMVLLSLLGLVLVTYLAYVVHLVLVYGLSLAAFRVAPWTFFWRIRDAVALSFTTSSSLGTLPVTIESAKKAGVDDQIAAFTLPLGATVNMDGGAIRLGIAALFAAHIVGVDLTFMDMLMIVLTATLASVGTAGVPGAGLMALTMVLTQTGLPLEVVALIAGVDAIVQMGSTALNVIGDLVGAKLMTVLQRRDERRSADDTDEAQGADPTEPVDVPATEVTDGRTVESARPLA